MSEIMPSQKASQNTPERISDDFAQANQGASSEPGASSVSAATDPDTTTSSSVADPVTSTSAVAATPSKQSATQTGKRRSNPLGAALLWILAIVIIVVLGLVISAYMAGFESVFEMIDWIADELSTSMQ